MAQSLEYPDLRFVPPRASGRGRDGYSVQFVVVHHTAGSERSTSAEDGAAYDAKRTDGVSTHYFHDSNSSVQCVYTWDRSNTAWHYGNRLGIHHELCGTLQTRAQWLDPASDATISNAARQIARDCRKYGIPARKITPAQMRAGTRGICGHWDVTLAYGLGDHTDPGPHFPWDILIARVQTFLTAPAKTASVQEDDMANVNQIDWEALIARMEGVVVGRHTVGFGPTRGEPIKPNQNLDALNASVGALRVALEALTGLINAGGGDIDTAAVLTRVDELAAAEQARDQAYTARIANLQTQLAATRTAAEANLSPAERAALGGTDPR